ncbi:hypothetical protein QFC22_005624 [Naganishia vaughanmartiniae]|uniref:Uncharacterized protein n=1 Tax=Naganishia vaughanmartiniae TaxID=1424756 RepID=A0ACC2WTC5_9TREE|nr:hypothetical protein QFC22_005624 [Naganishia vaughanmartiniae]
MSTTVYFTSNNIRIAALFFPPKNHVGGSRSPGIVVSHPGGGVKEQTASIYAQRLADQGFAALAFDAAYQGESEGTPRGLEDPAQRVEDIKCAVSYLTTRSEIDPERIAALGICASGGYVPYAAQTDVRIKAVGTVSAFDSGDAVRNGLDGKQTPEALQQMLAYSTAMRTAEANGAEPAYTEIIPPNREQGGEGYDYYLTPRGQHPRSTNKQLVRSLDRLVQFDAFRFMEMVAPRPVLMVAGTEAFSKHYSERAIELAKGTNNELFLIEGATHMSLYDQEEHVGPAVKKLVEFYNTALKV